MLNLQSRCEQREDRGLQSSVRKRFSEAKKGSRNVSENQLRHMSKSRAKDLFQHIQEMQTKPCSPIYFTQVQGAFVRVLCKCVF